jgi:hypothetical protein
MKSKPNKIASLLCILLTMALMAQAQAPNMFNYQAVARDASGNIIASQNIGIRFTVLAGSATGTTAYQETQVAMTNSLGLFTAAIGGGTVVSGTIAGVSWGSSSEYLKVEIDPTGGTSYTVSGTSQLLSVPYALNAGSGGGSQWATSGTNIYNTNSGNVGIGTSTPQAALNVNSNDMAAFIQGYSPWLGLKDSSNTGGYLYDSYVWQTGNLMEFGNYGDVGHGGPIDFYTGGSPMLLDTVGRVFINPRYSNALANSVGGNYTMTVADSNRYPVGVYLGQAGGDAIDAFVDNNVTTLSDAYGIYSYCNTTYGKAAYLSGNVTVVGTLTATTKNFRIDDPRDPANKFLYHASIESNDMMDIYNGNITTDANGDAMVQLPSYFETINGDFKYQLTCIGTFAQAIVSEKENNNQFKIRTNQPNVEVSWQIAGVRHDPASRVYNTIPEVDKTGNEKGYYQNPEVYGLGREMSIDQHKHDLHAKHEAANAAKGTGQAQAIGGPRAKTAQGTK